VRSVAVKQLPKMQGWIVQHLFHSKKVSCGIDAVCAFDIAGKDHRVSGYEHKKQPGESLRLPAQFVSGKQNHRVGECDRFCVRVQMRGAKNDPRRDEPETESGWYQQVRHFELAATKERQHSD